MADSEAAMSWLEALKRGEPVAARRLFHSHGTKMLLTAQLLQPLRTGIFSSSPVPPPRETTIASLSP
jgi:hypothetical protein